MYLASVLLKDKSQMNIGLFSLLRVGKSMLLDMLLFAAGILRLIHKFYQLPSELVTIVLIKEIWIGTHLPSKIGKSTAKLASST